MAITFHPMTTADTEAVIGFLSSNQFPFHVDPAPSAEKVRAGVENGRFWNEESQGYWIDDGGVWLGISVLQDLQDDTPMFDLRLEESQRGQGRGAEVVRALCDMVFNSMPGILRFEGQTREDNIAMRKTFLRAGFIKEAHYRLGWPTNDGGHVASVAYGILRQDWESGTTTAIEWDDISA